MTEAEDRLHRLESEIERRLLERFAGLRDEFDRLRLESDRRWAGFLSRFDQDFSGLVPPELVLPEPAQPVSDRPAGAGLISIELARSLDNANNQVEALHRFLELCRRHASRAALLISKSGSFVVWKSTGFSDSGGNDEATRRVTLPMDVEPLAKVIEGTAYRLEPDNELSMRLGATDVAAAVLVPMVVKEKVSGAVYADTTRAAAGGFDPESIAFLTFLAGLFVDRLAGRKLKPAPALRPLQEPGTVSGAAQAEPVDAPAFEAESHEPAAEEFPARASNRESFGTKILSFDAMAAAPEAVEPPPPPPPAMRFSEPDVAPSERPSRPAPPLPPSAPEPSLAYEPDEPAPRRPEPQKTSLPPSSALSSSGVPFAPPSPPSPPAPPAASAVPPAPPAPPSAVSDTGTARLSTGARRLAGPLAPLEGDERHEEARRFAKLLVSEIKLYNEKAVLEGRQHGNLYDRLKEDIDRSRQMYDERIPEDVRANTNFFYEELVRILADGRAEALGI